MVIIDKPADWLRICEVYHTPDGQEYTMGDVTDVIHILNRYPVQFKEDVVRSGKLTLPSEWYDCGQDAIMRMQTGVSPVRALFYLMEPSVRLKPAIGARRAARYDKALMEHLRTLRERNAYTGAPTLPRIHPLTAACDFSNMLATVYVMNRLAGLRDRVLNP